MQPTVIEYYLTATNELATAVDCMKNGAYDYMLKPFDPNELGVLIEKIIRHQDQNREMQFLREEVKERTRFESMIGQSVAMQKIFRMIDDIKDVDSPVLITGETGSGKGLCMAA